ncbi:MAG: EamA/RhaT family transporter [Deltaproteobacteria bacterium]|nr:MAG: EamA/RhaT family transporter [Deltaproteobacteria bacterium]
MKTRNRRHLAEFLLATVTIFWGATFPIVKEAIEEVPVLCFLWVRFLFAAILLALFAGPKGFATLNKEGYLKGIFLGVLLFASYITQTYGLSLTTSSNTGFLTGLNVVWVSLLAGPILKKPPAPGAKIGVVCAVAGLFMLTWQGSFSINPGDALVSLCAFFVALHILGLDALTKGYDGRALAFVQIMTMAVLGAIGSYFFEPVSWPRVWSSSLIWALIITAVFATTYAFWVQTTFQKWTTPTRAALIYTLEPVFAAVFSIWLLSEKLSTIGWIGGALIVCGMVVAEALPARKPKST